MSQPDFNKGEGLSSQTCKSIAWLKLGYAVRSTHAVKNNTRGQFSFDGCGSCMAAWLMGIHGCLEHKHVGVAAVTARTDRAPVAWLRFLGAPAIH